MVVGQLRDSRETHYAGVRAIFLSAMATIRGSMFCRFFF